MSRCVAALLTLALLLNTGGCSGGWITPDEVNKTYDLSKLEEAVLAYYEAINNRDVPLFLRVLDLPVWSLAKVAVTNQLRAHDPEKQRVLKYRIERVKIGEGFATVYIRLQVKDYDRILETEESLDFVRVDSEWKSKGFYGFPW